MTEQPMPTIQGDMLTWRAVYEDGSIDYEYTPEAAISTRYNEIRLDQLKEFHVLFALQRLEGIDHGAPFLRIHVQDGAKLLWRKRTRMRAKDDGLMEKIYLVGLRQIVGGQVLESIMYASFQKGVAFTGIRLSDTENDIEYYPWELFPEETGKQEDTSYIDDYGEGRGNRDAIRGISEGWR